MQNKLVDLNNHLFMVIEKLNDDELTGEALESEMKRASTITSVANAIIQNGRLALQVYDKSNEWEKFSGSKKLPEMLSLPVGEKPPVGDNGKPPIDWPERVK